MMKTILLVLLLAPIAVAQADKQPAPKVVRLMLCEKIDPPPQDAKPQTTTLQCDKKMVINNTGSNRWNGEVTPIAAIALEIPDTYATFEGKKFWLELLNDDGNRFNPKLQPKGSVVRLSPPCAKKTSKLGYRIEPLQQGPCNPELTPQ